MNVAWMNYLALYASKKWRCCPLPPILRMMPRLPTLFDDLGNRGVRVTGLVNNAALQPVKAFGRYDARRLASIAKRQCRRRIPTNSMHRATASGGWGDRQHRLHRGSGPVTRPRALLKQQSGTGHADARRRAGAWQWTKYSREHRIARVSSIGTGCVMTGRRACGAGKSGLPWHVLVAPTTWLSPCSSLLSPGRQTG